LGGVAAQRLGDALGELLQPIRLLQDQVALGRREGGNVGVAGDQHRPQPDVMLARAPDQLHPVHAGHRHIHEQQIDRLVPRQHIERGRAVLG